MLEKILKMVSILRKLEGIHEISGSRTLIDFHMALNNISFCTLNKNYRTDCRWGFRLSSGNNEIIYVVVWFQFVDEKVQWMHIDIAGPVWNDKKRAATGFGVSTLVEWVLKNSS